MTHGEFLDFLRAAETTVAVETPWKFKHLSTRRAAEQLVATLQAQIEQGAQLAEMEEAAG